MRQKLHTSEDIHSDTNTHAPTLWNILRSLWTHSSYMCIPAHVFNSNLFPFKHICHFVYISLFHTLILYSFQDIQPNLNHFSLRRFSPSFDIFIYLFKFFAFHILRFSFHFSYVFSSYTLRHLSLTFSLYNERN